MLLRILLVVIAVVSPLLPGATAVAKDGAGLVVSPLAKQLDVQSGTSRKNSYITVENQTDDVLKIKLSASQFTVADYTYNYQFRPIEYDWLTFRQKEVQLKPGATTNVYYDLDIPEHAAAGTYYFALFASARMTDGGVGTTGRVTSLLYLSVDGDKGKKSATLANQKLPSVVTGLIVPVAFEAKNTGNLHLDGHFYARLRGMVGGETERRDERALIPATVRSTSLDLPAPLWPGIYELEYGYAVGGKSIVKDSVYVVYLPVWSLVALVFLALLAIYA